MQSLSHINIGRLLIKGKGISKLVMFEKCSFQFCFFRHQDSGFRSFTFFFKPYKEIINQILYYLYGCFFFKRNPIIIISKMNHTYSLSKIGGNLRSEVQAVTLDLKYTTL